MSEFGLPSEKALSQNKIFGLFSLIILICLTAIGFNIYHEVKQSSQRIGIQVQMIKDGVILTHVLESGPSFQAGIEADSFLVSVNNKPVLNLTQLDEALALEDAEANIVTLKDGIKSSYTVQKGEAPLLRQFFIYILVCALFLALAFISIPSQGGRYTTRNLLLIFLFLFLGLEYILFPVRDLLAATEGWPHQAAIAGTVLAGIAGGLTFALELHILCVTPKPQPWFIKNKKLILSALYSVSVYFIFILILTYLNPDPEGITGSLFSFYTWSIIDILWVILILSIFLIQYLGTQSRRGKNQLVILFAGMLPFVISLSLIEWNYLTGSSEQDWLEPLEIFASFSFSIGFMIAIKRYDLADIGHDIQRPFVFKVISLLIIFYLLNSLYDYVIKTGNLNQSNLLYFGVYSLFIGMMWFPLSRLLQYWASNPWHSDSENSHPVLNNVLDSIMAYNNNKRAAENLPRLLNSSLQSSWVAISLTSHNGKPYFHYEQNKDDDLPVEQIEKELISLFHGKKNNPPSWQQSTNAPTLFELGATQIFPLIYHNEIFGGIALSHDSEHDQISNKALNNFSDQLTEIIFTNHMRSLATLDGLTNILRREAVLEKLHGEFIRYQRTGEEISICLVDLDHFKQVNDTYGHAAGDEVLKQTATLLKDKIRNTDFVGRYGGEEFLLVFPKTEVAESKIFLETLRHAIQTSPIKINKNNSINITVSIGITSTDILHNRADKTPYKLIQKLIEEADIALYLAKEMGRNKVVIAPDTQFD